jgi:putative hydrolase of the HAD superfamily
MMGKIKAVMLDLDDTIITDDAVSQHTWRAVCRQFETFTGNIPAEELYARIQSIANAYWRNDDNHRKGRFDLKAARRNIVCAALRELRMENDALGCTIADSYTQQKDLAIKPFPGALDTLRSLKESGLKLALITNGSADIQRSKIGRFGLDSIFDVILIEGEFGAGKPDPGVFTYALNTLSAIAAETCMVGDDLKRDIASAQALGIYSIWIDWKGTGLPPHCTVKPDYVIRSLEQIRFVPRIHSLN